MSVIGRRLPCFSIAPLARGVMPGRAADAASGAAGTGVTMAYFATGYIGLVVFGLVPVLLMVGVAAILNRKQGR